MSLCNINTKVLLLYYRGIDLINYLTNWCNNCIKQSNSLYSNTCYFLLFHTIDPYILFIWTWTHYGYFTVKNDNFHEFILSSDWRGLKDENGYIILKQLLNNAEISLPNFIPSELKKKIIYTGAMLNLMKESNSPFYDLCIINQPNVKPSDIFNNTDILSQYKEHYNHVIESLNQVVQEYNKNKELSKQVKIQKKSEIEEVLKRIAENERIELYKKQNEKQKEYNRLKKEYENAIEIKKIKRMKQLEDEKIYIEQKTGIFNIILESLSRKVLGSRINPTLRLEAQKYLYNQYNEKIAKLEEEYKRRREFLIDEHEVYSFY